MGLVSENGEDLSDVTFLPVLTRHAPEPSHLPLNFTLCMPTLFNHYDNVLQFVQVWTLTHNTALHSEPPPPMLQ